MTDRKFAIRHLFKKPGFTEIAVVTLTLAPAGNMTLFSVFNTPCLRRIPFVKPGRPVDLEEFAPNWDAKYLGSSYVHFNEWGTHNRTFEGIAAWRNDS